MTTAFKIIALTKKNDLGRRGLTLSLNACTNRHAQAPLSPFDNFSNTQVLDSAALRKFMTLPEGEAFLVPPPQITNTSFTRSALLLTFKPIREIKKRLARRAEGIAKQFSIRNLSELNLDLPHNVPSESLEPTRYCNFAKLSGNTNGFENHKEAFRVPTQLVPREATPENILSSFERVQGNGEVTFAEGAGPKEQLEAMNLTLWANYLMEFYRPNNINEAIETIFAFVQEHRCMLGSFHATAYDTLNKGYGTCSNKMNLFVGLCRAIGIPAGFVMYEASAPDYFGEGLQIPEISFWVQSESVHFSAIVHNGDKWLLVDPSDNYALCVGAYSTTLLPVFFDAENPQSFGLYIDPNTVKRSSVLFSIDNFLQKDPYYKSPKVPCYMAFLTLYLDFVQNNNKKEKTNGKKHELTTDFSQRFKELKDWLSMPGDNGSMFSEQYRKQVLDTYLKFLGSMSSLPLNISLPLIQKQDQVEQAQLQTIKDRTYAPLPQDSFLKWMRQSYGDIFSDPENVKLPLPRAKL